MISDLRLQKFRSYVDATFEFGAGVNIIVGPNASGKTNLLEAVLVLCRGGSYRGSDKDLVAHNQPWSRLDGHISGQERSLKMQIEAEAIAKSFVINGANFKRLPTVRTIPAVIFEPNNLRLLTQSPEERRNFFDDIIEQTTPLFADLRRKYKRTLAQRNRLLKQDFLVADMFIWDVRLSELGGQIAASRLEFISNNKQELGKIYNKLAGKKIIADMIYDTSINTQNYSSSMLGALEARISVDKERGFTTIGPHRDDICLMLGGHLLAASASRGETRTMLLALKLLEVQILENARGVKPIMLLDDVFSELDGSRRRTLTDYLQAHQTFITTTDADIVIQHFLNNCTVIPTNQAAS